MRILIVNGYSLSETSNQEFDKYQDAIKQVFMGQKELLDTETEFFVRDQSNLEEFLYEADSGQASRQAARQFDFIDLVFIQMESNLRPWSPFAFKMVMLIRMCLRTNKIMFGSSAAMQAIVFLVATNFECPIQIVNGVNGGLLGDLSKVQKPLDKIKHNEYFLDNVTGDLYGIHYDQEIKESQWYPVANCGIHSRKAAEEFKKIGQFMIKAPIYKSKASAIEKVYISRINEDICFVKKNQMNHWLLKGIEQQQLVHSQHAWDVHAFNIVNPSKVFITLADSLRGPQIVQINENIIGTQFYIDKKYQPSITILKNFILYQLTRIRCGYSKAIPIIEANNFIRQKKLEVENLTSQDGTQQSESKGQFAKLKFHLLTKFNHAGYAAKKYTNQEVVVNNAINDKILRTTSQLDRPPERPQTSIPNSQANLQALSRPTSRQFQIRTVNDLTSIHKENDSFVEDAITNPYPFQKTQSEIRQMLHPHIKKEGVPAIQQLWVPGRMSKAFQPGRSSVSPQKRPFTSASETFNASQISLLRVQSAQLSSKSRGIQMRSSLVQTQDQDPFQLVQPYISAIDQARKDQNKKDKLIIGHRTIRMSLDPSASIQSILFQSPYNPASISQFIKPDKSKWVGAENFKSF